MPPTADVPVPDPAAEAEIGALMRLVTEVRRFRSDQGLRPGQEVAAVLDGIEATALAAHEPHIRSLLRLAAAPPGFTQTASLSVQGVTVRLDLAGTIDVAAERRRLEKDLAAARKEEEQTSRKLANPAFTEKAPPGGRSRHPRPPNRRSHGDRPHRIRPGVAPPA